MLNWDCKHLLQCRQGLTIPGGCTWWGTLSTCTEGGAAKLRHWFPWNSGWRRRWDSDQPSSLATIYPHVSSCRRVVFWHGLLLLFYADNTCSVLFTRLSLHETWHVLRSCFDVSMYRLCTTVPPFVYELSITTCNTCPGRCSSRNEKNRHIRNGSVKVGKLSSVIDKVGKNSFTFERSWLLPVAFEMGTRTLPSLFSVGVLVRECCPVWPAGSLASAKLSSPSLGRKQERGRVSVWIRGNGQLGDIQIEGVRET